jgi:exodeoxyribonuclease VII small subunit
VVSAIGHEADRPILDDVADLRASTPTDAAKRIVPDLNEEFAGLDMSRQRLDRAMGNLLTREGQVISALRQRPVLANPHSMIESRADDLQRWRERATALIRHRVQRAGDEIAHLRAQVRALSPQQTLDRGYSVTQLADGSVVRAAEALAGGEQLRIRVASGKLTATVDQIFPAEQANKNFEGQNMSEHIPADIKNLSYEQAREELMTVVNQLETGGVPLEASLALWERGEALAAHCENWLNGVSERLDQARARVENATD